MIRRLAPHFGSVLALGLGLGVAACQQPGPSEAADPSAPIDPVIDAADLTLPPEAADAPPPIGQGVSAPPAGASSTGPPPPLPPEETLRIARVL